MCCFGFRETGRHSSAPLVAGFDKPRVASPACRNNPEGRGGGGKGNGAGLRRSDKSSNGEAGKGRFISSVVGAGVYTYLFRWWIDHIMINDAVDQ